MSQSRGLFLDLDGTLADSLNVMRTVYNRFLKSYARRGSVAEFDGLNGPPLPEVVRCLAMAHGLDEPFEDLLGIYRGLIVDAYDSVVPMPGAVEVVETARRQGWVVGVVTSNGREAARRWLARTGLAAGVDVLVTDEDVTQGKPAPDPYRAALAKGRCAAAQSIAVEDSPQGAQAAVAAGLRTFGLGAPASSDVWPDRVEPIAGLAQLLPYLREDGHV